MFTNLIAGSFLGFGLLFVAAPDPKPGDCCAADLPCCMEAKACCGTAKVAPKAPITEAKGCCGPAKPEAKTAHCGEAAKGCCAPSIK